MPVSGNDPPEVYFFFYHQEKVGDIMRNQNYRLRYIFSILLTIICSSTASRAGDWSISRVLDGMSLNTIGSESLVMKTSGRPAIAFSGDHLYYAQHTGTAWPEPTIVDDTPDAGVATLACDTMGFPFIAYINKQNGMIRVAYQHMTLPGPGIAWTIETIGPASSSEYTSPSLALDSQGYPHVAYLNNFGNLAYAYKAIDGWHTGETVDLDTDRLSGAPSLALTSDNQAHIAYTVYATSSAQVGKVRHANQQCGPLGCYWLVEEVKTGETDMWNARGTGPAQLKIDATDCPHVFWPFQYGELRQILHYKKSTNSWQDMELDTSYTLKSNFVVQQDSSGGFHLCWKESGNDRFVYQGPSGTTTVLLEGLPSYSSLSMALTDANVPLVAFTAESIPGRAYALNILQNPGTGWVVETPYKKTDFGSNDLALDGLGQPHFAYSDAVSREIRLVDYDGSTWTQQLIGSDVSVNGDPALALSPNDSPNVAYIDADTNAVILRRYLCKLSLCSWSKETVDDAGGAGVNLEIDADYTPHLSYRRSTELLYTKRSDSSWQISYPASGTASINANSMVLSSSNTPKIAYLSNYQNIYVANRICGASICIWDTMGPANSANYDTLSLTLQLDSTSNPHIAAVDSGLDYFWFDGTNWNSRRISDEIDYLSGKNADFSLGPNDQPCFVFSAETGENQYDLKYTARYNIRNQILWFTTTISSFDYEVSPRLKVDPSGQPHVIYVDAGNDLMYAVQKNVPIQKLNIVPMLELLLLGQK